MRYEEVINHVLRLAD